jgi:hypothetical protein
MVLTSCSLLHGIVPAGGKHGDMAYAAAFIIHTTPMLTELDAFSWWTISDICACDSLSLQCYLK